MKHVSFRSKAPMLGSVLTPKQVERKIIPAFFKVLKADEAGDIDARSDAVCNLQLEIDQIAGVADEEVSHALRLFETAG
jgi:hypothetical protein